MLVEQETFILFTFSISLVLVAAVLITVNYLPVLSGKLHTKCEV